MNITRLRSITRRLVNHGFQPTGAVFHRHGMSARLDARWLTFLATGSLTVDSAKAGVNSHVASKPGLWKQVRGRGGSPVRIFDLPLSAICDSELADEDTCEADCPLEEIIGWAVATEAGKLPAKWQVPPSRELAQSLPGKALTLESGPFARQGNLCCEGSRLTVSIPLLHRVPSDLSAPRSAWLSRLLADVHDRSRLVRVIEKEIDNETTSILVEVDLSGAPRFALPRLVRIGVDAVRHVVSQSISAVELLVDPAVTSTVWEYPSVQERPAEGSQK
jgi:hypothetical protein